MDYTEIALTKEQYTLLEEGLQPEHRFSTKEYWDKGVDALVFPKFGIAFVFDEAKARVVPA